MGGREVKSRFFSEYICYHLKSCLWLSHPQKSSSSSKIIIIDARSGISLMPLRKFQNDRFLELPAMVIKIGTL